MNESFKNVTEIKKTEGKKKKRERFKKKDYTNVL